MNPLTWNTGNCWRFGFRILDIRHLHASCGIWSIAVWKRLRCSSFLQTQTPWHPNLQLQESTMYNVLCAIISIYKYHKHLQILNICIGNDSFSCMHSFLILEQGADASRTGGAEVKGLQDDRWGLQPFLCAHIVSHSQTVSHFFLPAPPFFELVVLKGWWRRVESSLQLNSQVQTLRASELQKASRMAESCW